MPNTRQSFPTSTSPSPTTNSHILQLATPLTVMFPHPRPVKQQIPQKHPKENREQHKPIIVHPHQHQQISHHKINQMQQRPQKLLTKPRPITLAPFLSLVFTPSMMTLLLLPPRPARTLPVHLSYPLPMCRIQINRTCHPRLLRRQRPQRRRGRHPPSYRMGRDRFRIYQDYLTGMAVMLVMGAFVGVVTEEVAVVFPSQAPETF